MLLNLEGLYSLLLLKALRGIKTVFVEHCALLTWQLGVLRAFRLV